MFRAKAWWCLQKACRQHWMLHQKGYSEAFENAAAKTKLRNNEPAKSSQTSRKKFTRRVKIRLDSRFLNHACLKPRKSHPRCLCRSNAHLQVSMPAIIVAVPRIVNHQSKKLSGGQNLVEICYTGTMLSQNLSRDLRGAGFSFRGTHVKCFAFAALSRRVLLLHFLFLLSLTLCFTARLCVSCLR